MKKQLSPILGPLSKTNIDSDESANYDSRLLPPMGMEVGVRVSVFVCVYTRL